MTLNELKVLAQSWGYRIEVEEKSYVDSTLVYAIYRGFVRAIRFGSIAAAANWLNGG